MRAGAAQRLRQSLDIPYLLPDGPKFYRLAKEGTYERENDDARFGIEGTPLEALCEFLAIKMFPSPSYNEHGELSNWMAWRPGAYLKTTDGPYAKVIVVSKWHKRAQLGKRQQLPVVSEVEGTYSLPQYFGKALGFPRTVPKAVYAALNQLLLIASGCVEPMPLSQYDEQGFERIARELFQRVREGKCRPDRAIALGRVAAIAATMQQVQSSIRGQLSPTALAPAFVARVQHAAAHKDMLRALLVEYYSYGLERSREGQTSQKRLGWMHFEKAAHLLGLTEAHYKELASDEQWPTYSETYIAELITEARKLGIIKRIGIFDSGESRLVEPYLWSVGFAPLTEDADSLEVATSQDMADMLAERARQRALLYKYIPRKAKRPKLRRNRG
ncbi:MAG: hypothetical protein SF172_17960 [Burkholderiales bacterium]|nr:hypothetical protein [Burkholderiales bacterium]